MENFHHVKVILSIFVSNTWFWQLLHLNLTKKTLYLHIREQPIFRIDYADGNKKAGLSTTLEEGHSTWVFLFFYGMTGKFENLILYTRFSTGVFNTQSDF